MNHQNLYISEIFESIQGEGERIGTPSMFIRVSGCNLRCIWCDTKYSSWDPEGSIIPIAEIIERAVTSNTKDVVLTGGEPMIFEGCIELVCQLKEAGKYVTIETAGTVFQVLPADLMSISPKLGNSTPIGTRYETSHELIRKDKTNLKRLTDRYNCQLKFVVQPPVLPGETEVAFRNDLKEIKGILADLGQFPSNRVFLMPEGRDSKTLWERSERLIAICHENGWRIGPRLQIDLFGDTRGT